MNPALIRILTINLHPANKLAVDRQKGCVFCIGCQPLHDRRNHNLRWRLPRSKLSLDK